MKTVLLSIVICAGLAAANLTGFVNDWLKSAPNIADPNNDYNDDGIVNLEDFVFFAQAYEPEPYANERPTALAVSANVVQYISSNIQLAGTDDGYPKNRIDYIVTSMPATGHLYDMLLEYDTSSMSAMKLGNQARRMRQIKSVPYVISHSSKWLYYLTDANGLDTFTYKTNDTLADSNEATVTLIVATNPKDTLSFDGFGLLTIPDANAVEFDDSFCITLWVKTKQLFGSLIKKRGSSGAGFELTIEAGRSVAHVWDANGTHGEIHSWANIATGNWEFIGVSANASGIIIYNANKAVEYKKSSLLPKPPYSNNANILVGNRFVGEIDKLNFWPYKDSWGLICIFIDFGAVDYLARFNFSEHSGTSTVDAVDANNVGTISDANHVKWYPTELPLYEYRPQF